MKGCPSQADTWDTLAAAGEPPPPAPRPPATGRHLHGRTDEASRQASMARVQGAHTLARQEDSTTWTEEGMMMKR